MNMINFKNIQLNRASDVWDLKHGCKESAFDYSGRKIIKSEYKSQGENGWDIDYILPVRHGGTSHLANLLIVHRVTKEERNEGYPIWTANKRMWEVASLDSYQAKVVREIL